MAIRRPSAVPLVFHCWSCWLLLALLLSLTCALLPTHSLAQQPTEPVDVSPGNGESYYLINQLSGLQADLASGASATAQPVTIQNRSFTGLSQRWAFTRLPNGSWAISNLSNGECLSGATNSGNATTAAATCVLASSADQWTLNPVTNGYVTLTNQSTGLVLDISGSSSSAGATLTQTSLASAPSQSQQWLLRPAFFRGIDNALLEKQEADRLAAGLPWWQDAGKSADQLLILKNHGVNLVRIRPTSAPPYQSLSLNGSSPIPATCTSNGCYAETEEADLDLARRAKQLGLSVELTLFFDGASSLSTPGAWAAYSLPQLTSAVYNYVKAEVESYRSAGVMPDIVTIGNEVDTGMFGSMASPGSSFTGFAAVQQQGMQAVLDAASDTALGPAIPPPLRCIHITPAWNLTTFFTEAHQNSIPFDAICQSYYPIYHGPLTATQAAASNPGTRPIEQSVLANAATTLAVPIFLIEVGEHYENGFAPNDPWYPPTVAGQRQFLIDVNDVLKALPNHLGMGFEYWDPGGVNTTSASGAFTNGDNKTNATYIWNGLTLFDNADTSGSAQSSAVNYSAILAAADALGGRLDQTLNYMLINVATGKVLGTAGVSANSATPLAIQSTDGGTTLAQQWSISSSSDGYLNIANLNLTQGAASQALDSGPAGASGSLVVLNNAQSGSASQEWNLLSAGDQNYTLVNKANNLVLASEAGSTEIVLQSPASSNPDWITPANNSQLWQVVPAHITEPAVPVQLSFVSGVPSSANYGAALNRIEVDVLDASGSLVTTATSSVTLTIAGPNHYASTLTVSSSNGIAGFDLSKVALGSVGAYSLAASANAITTATAAFTVVPVSLSVAAQNIARAFGVSNPALLYSITGFVNGDSQSAVAGVPSLSTSAVVPSAPGTYPIAVAAGTLAAANYVFTLVPGTLTVTPAPTTTTLSASSTSVNPGQNVTLTATVTTPSTIAPAGTMNFLSGTTLLSSAASNATGVSNYTGALLPGVNSLTATFVAASDFAPSTSPAVSVNEPDYSLTTTQTSLNLSAGGSAMVPFTLTPVGGYQGTVTMTCASSLPELSCVSSPTDFAVSGPSTALSGTATITAATNVASLLPGNRQERNTQRPPPGLAWLLGAFALLFVPRTGKRSKNVPRRISPRFLSALLVFGLLLAPIGIASCGGGASTSPPPATTGTVTLTATGTTGNTIQTLKITVTLQ